MRIALIVAAVLATPAAAQVTYPPADTSNLATKSEVQAAQASADSAVKTVNGSAPTSGNVTVAVPTPASNVPPAVADAGTAGNMTTVYALANHTHASKARRDRVLVPISGTRAVTFSSPFNSAPLCAVVAETTPGDANVVNAQIDGPTSATGMTIRITRTQTSVAAVLGLTILSVPTQIATYAHYICIET